jgi:hypothetical protein
MADDLGPILPDPGDEPMPGGIDTTDTPDFPPDPAPPDDAGPEFTDTPPVDGLPIDDPLGAPGVGMDVPDEPGALGE